MITSRVFSELLKAYTDGVRYADSCGGARSTKTYSALQLLIILAMNDKLPTLTSVVSETFPHLKKGAIRDFETIMRTEGLWDEDAWNATDKIYTFSNGASIEFFSADSPGKVHGPARDRLFINEAQNISWEVARQLFIRTRGFIVIDYNPTHEFWVHKHIQPDTRTRTIHSTFRDNPFLTKDQVQDLMAGQSDENWWRVYGLGLVGRLEGVIYEFEQIDEMPEAYGLTELYGLDYGFTNSFTAMVHLLADPKRKICYIDEQTYERGLLNSDILERMHEKRVPKTAPIYADCAEPKSNEELKRKGGYRIIESYKGKEIAHQISYMKEWKLMVTKRSTNWIHEARNYAWAKNQDSEKTNTPIKQNDHCMDATRYALFTHFRATKAPARDGKMKSSRAW